MNIKAKCPRCGKLIKHKVRTSEVKFARCYGCGKSWPTLSLARKRDKKEVVIKNNDVIYKDR